MILAPTKLGKTLGPPWREEHRVAYVAAFAALAK
jgi:hypothetical protein